MTHINVWLSTEDRDRLKALKDALRSPNLDDALAKILQYAYGEIVLRAKSIMDPEERT